MREISEDHKFLNPITYSTMRDFSEDHKYSPGGIQTMRDFSEDHKYSPGGMQTMRDFSEDHKFLNPITAGSRMGEFLDDKYGEEKKN